MRKVLKADIRPAEDAGRAEEELAQRMLADYDYLSGKTYYLGPDAPVGQRPYAVLRRAMVEENRYAIAQIVLHGHEQTVLLRPLGNLLAMSMLNLENEVAKPN